MKTYVAIDGRELSLIHLNDSLSRACLALRGLNGLIRTALNSHELGEASVCCLTLAELALETITRETENLLPEWKEAQAAAW